MIAKTLTPRVLATLPIPRPDGEATKRIRGTVLVIAGAAQTPGAAILAATASLRAGAGTLQVATVRSRAAQVGTAVPEALVIDLPETASGAISPRSAPRLGEAIGEADAILFGPGMLEASSTKALLGGVLALIGRAVLVVDAAGLRVAASHRPAFRKLQRPAILTPHESEMASLLGWGKPRVAKDRPEAALEASRRFRAVAVLKGEETLIAGPHGELFRNRSGNPGLATSGSGDTLAGVVAGLAARGATELAASAWAAFVHGRAGDRLAKRLAPLGFLARELLDEIPALLANRRRSRR